MAVQRNRSGSKLVRTAGLLASASFLSMFGANAAQAACTPSTPQPLNNITAPGTLVNCDGPNSGETIVANTNTVRVEVNGAGDTLNNSTVTFNDESGWVTVANGGSMANTIITSTGANTEVSIGGLGLGIGSAPNLTLFMTGDGGSLRIGAGSFASADPGFLQFTNPTSGGYQGVSVQGTLAALGNNGGNYLIQGGTGSQELNISGTLTVQPNGLAFDGGADQDIVIIRASAVINGGTGNNIQFNGGAGADDRFTIVGGGSRDFNTVSFEELLLLPGTGNTLLLGGSGDYTSITIGAGTVEVASDAPLGQSNSDIRLANASHLRLNPAAAFTFGHSLTGNGILEQTGQIVTYNGTTSINGPFVGNFTISGGTAIINSGSQFGTGTITNNSALELTNITLGNAISGTGTVTKISGGTGTLTGINTYSGGTDVDAGTLRITNSGAVGSGVVNIAGGANFELDFASDLTFANDITGAGGLVKRGFGVATLTGTNTYSGGTDIQQGGIRVDGFARLGTGPVTTASGTALFLDYNGAGQLLQTAPFMTGDGLFVKEGTGDVVMSQSSTYTGGTIILEGRIGLNNGDALGTGNIHVTSGAELGIGGIVLNNTITGTGLIRKTAPNFAELYGDNSGFTGIFRVEQGEIFATDGKAFGSGTLQIDTGNTAYLNGGGTTMAADLTGGGVFEKSGSGTAILSGDGTAFSGTLSIVNGTAQIEGTQNIGGATVLIGSAGTLQLDTAGFTVFNNTVLGAGNVIKTGTGTVFVTGSNSYSGGTDIQQGALRVTDVSFLGTGPITVQSGAFLDLSIAGTQSLNQTVTGAGALRKSDLGDLTLLSNSLTGGLDIVGGRVIVSNAAAIGGGPVSMAADTQLVFNNSTTEGISNPISGAGTLTKDGTGLLAVNSANTYSGGTLVNNGRIVANATGAFGTGQVVVLSGAEVGIGGVTIANNISGSGMVIKTANNTGTLTGTNTYSGGTDIQQGTLVVNSPAALGTGGVSTASGTALNINYNGASNAVMTNVLSGNGSLIKDGSGTVVINTAGNTYSGGTTINAGRLGLNFSDALGTGNVVINSGAELGIGGITLANNVSGAGRIVKTGSLTANLTGTNTHSGGIDIQGGAVNVTGNGALGSGAVTIGSGTQLNYTNTAAATFSNGLSGAGTFNKLGAGQLSFVNNFSIGTLNVSAGSVRINSIATGNVNVAANTRLDGTGRIIGTLTNSGTVAPGNSIGTLTVQGNYVHNSGSVLEIEFDAAGNIDLLNVTGNATISGGTIRFVSIGGAEGQGGTFLSTGGTLTGTFATVETVGALLPLAVVYEPNRALMGPSVLTARPSTFNAQSLAAADTTLGFVDSIGAVDARHGTGNRIWMTGFGAWGSRSASGTTLGYDHNARGISGGITFDAGSDLNLGVSLGWADADIELTDNGGGGDQSSLLGAISARYAGRGFTLGGGLLYGKVDQDTLRNVSFSGFSGSVAGETDSNLFGGFLGLGVPLGSSGGWSFNANASGSYIRQEQAGYTESGTSPLRLQLGDLTTETMEGRAGLTAKTRLWQGNQGGGESPEALNLSVNLGGRFLGTLGERELPVTFAVSSAGIVLQGDKRDFVQAQFGLGLDYTAPSGAQFSLGYRGEAGKASRHAVQAGVSFAF